MFPATYFISKLHKQILMECDGVFNCCPNPIANLQYNSTMSHFKQNMTVIKVSN